MISHDIIDVKKYYENFIQLFNDVLLNNLSKQFDKSIYLYLKFSLEPVKNLLLVSNVLSHLFTCPRSNYAKNDCSFCSRLLFNRLFCPSNAIELQYDYLSIDIFFVDDVKKLFEEYSIDRIRINICFRSLEHYQANNSNEKRCLLICVFSNPCIIIVKFCETLVRILFNFFYNFSEDFVTDAGKHRQMLLEECLSFAHTFLRTTMKILKASKFNEIF